MSYVRSSFIIRHLNPGPPKVAEDEEGREEASGVDGVDGCSGASTGFNSRVLTGAEAFSGGTLLLVNEKDGSL